MRVWSLGQEDSLGGGHGNPFQYSCLENPMDTGAWQGTVHRIAKNWTQLKWFSMHTCTPDTYMILKKTQAQSNNLFIAFHCPEYSFSWHSSALICPSILKFQPSSHPITTPPRDLFLPASMFLLPWFHLFGWPFIFQGSVQVALLARSLPIFQFQLNFFSLCSYSTISIALLENSIQWAWYYIKVWVCIHHLCPTIHFFRLDYVFLPLYPCLFSSQCM